MCVWINTKITPPPTYFAFSFRRFAVNEYEAGNLNPAASNNLSDWCGIKVFDIHCNTATTMPYPLNGDAKHKGLCYMCVYPWHFSCQNAGRTTGRSVLWRFICNHIHGLVCKQNDYYYCLTPSAPLFARRHIHKRPYFTMEMRATYTVLCAWRCQRPATTNNENRMENQNLPLSKTKS